MNIVNRLLSVWNFLNGKKTTIGAVILFVVYVVKGLDTFFGFNFVDAVLLGQINDVGLVFTGVGLGHKVIKEMQ